MEFSDIQLSDKNLWQQIQKAWANGEYSTAQALMTNAQLNKKALLAKALNDLTDKIVSVEQLNDPTYDIDKIKVERQTPTDLPTGKIYFDWTNPPPYIWSEVDALNYTFEDIDNLNLTWAEVDKGGW